MKVYFQHGVDFSDTFAPVEGHDTIKLLVALAAKFGWKIYYLYLKFVFFNCLLEEDIYVEQPEGFQVPGKENQVYKLQKALYFLKWLQEPGTEGLMLTCCSKGSKEVQMKQLSMNAGNEEQLIASLYVDDLLVIGGNSNIE